MNVEEIPTFSSPQEEAKYWKNLTLEYRQKYQDAKDELDEFQINSRELEAELEAQLEQAEKRNKELKTLNNRLQVECESLKERLEKNHYENHNQISDLQEELGFIKALKDDLQKYIRELEQTNDDLERAKRATVVSLEDFESRLNQAIERNAFLESELDEKEALLVTVQRLKDEARDLRYELQIRNRSSLVNSPEPDNDRTCEKLFNPIDSNKLTVESETQTAPGSPVKTINNQLTTTSTPLTPSARISALNIVGDLLRKVGTLESKLASCRNFVKDTPRNYQTKNSPHHSPSAKYVLADSYGLSSGLRIRDATRTANKRPKQENPKEPAE